MRHVGKVSVAVGALAVVVWWAGSGQGDPGKLELAPASAGRSARLLPDSAPYHGLSWQIHHAAGSVEEARIVFREMADMGADSVLISNPGYQEHAGSESFKIDAEVTPSPDQWQQIIRAAHERGLRVILMPIILLSNPRGTEWRGVISPPSWDDWFEQYRNFLLHFAKIAAAGNVEVMTVGSELVSTEKYTEQWRRVIREVRAVYKGKLSYSANWDHYKVVEFWDALDLVGMTSYYKLSSEPNPTMETLLEAWKPIKRGLLRWQKETGRPLLFTEVGWASQEGASIEPWNYYYKQTATPGGLEEQKRCYQAFMDTWKDTVQVGGVIWWEWPNIPGGPDDYAYTPKGKPAERILREWFKSMHQTTQPAGKS